MYINRNQYQERHHKCHPAQGQVLLLLDILRLRLGEKPLDEIFSGTGLFYQDLLMPNTLISAEQIFKFFKKAKRLYPQDDLPFLLGHRLWPGHYSQSAPLLSFSQNLAQVIDVFTRFGPELSPLLQPRFFCDNDHLYVQWIDAYGMEDLTDFMIQAHMSGFISCVRHLSQEHWPWQCYLSHKIKTPSRANVSVNLGQFEDKRPINVMRLPIAYMQQAFSSASPSLFFAHEKHLTPCLTQPGILFKIYDVLFNNIDKDLSLNDLANKFAMSPATLKRKIKQHNSHYKHLDDHAKLSIALYLFKEKAWENQQVASYLQFKDTANFRRAFKRWCGLTPSQWKQA
ncbi:MAG: AraC family transcriptional regulator [Bermanella sp.]